MKNLPGNFSLPLLAVDALHLRGWVLGPTALSSDYSQSSECSELCWPQARAWAEDAHPPLGHLPRGKLWEASLGGWCWLATSGKIVKLWGKGYPLSVLFSLFSAVLTSCHWRPWLPISPLHSAADPERLHHVRLLPGSRCCCLVAKSCWLPATPWTVTRQAP